MANRGIAFAGTLIADIAYKINCYPKKGNLAWIRDPKVQTGGLNNVVIDIARMSESIPIKVSGLIGDDEYGRLILKKLGEYPNIDTRNITVWGRTPLTFAMTEEGSKQRTFFYDPGTSLSYEESHIDFNLLNADIFHLEYLLLLGALDEEDKEYGTRAARVLAEAKKRGMETSIDVVSDESGRYKEVVHPALKYTDYYIGNEVESSGIAGIKLYDESGLIKDRVYEALEELKRLGVGKWAVIHSPKCNYAMDIKTGEILKDEVAALEPELIKGTTGAGDAFCAGILYAAYEKKSLKEALYIAKICARASLLEEDSNLGVMKTEEMEKRIAYSLRK